MNLNSFSAANITPATSLKTVSAIVLNYISYDQTIRCVNDLLVQDYPELDVVVVDNHSPNESFRLLQTAFVREPRVTVIEAAGNLGYAGGNNFGCQRRLSEGSVDYLLIANNDTRLSDRTVLRQLLSFADRTDDLGGVGPKVVNTRGFIQGPYSRPNVIMRSLRYLFPIAPYIYSIWAREVKRESHPVPCYAIVGAFMLLKAFPFVKVGMFDTTTFLGAEEYILAEKFLKMGLRFYYFPSVFILHDHGKSAVGRTGREGWNAYSRGVESMVYYFSEYQKVGPAMLQFYRLSATVYGRAVYPLRKYFM
jgi:hypothetical protein